MNEQIIESQTYLRFLENLDKINRTIQRTTDLQQMMQDVLDDVLSIFDCDRAFVIYPCDPEADSWSVSLERTKPEYPGVLASGLDIPMETEVRELLRIMLDSDGPVMYGLGVDDPLPDELLEKFSIKLGIGMALYPKIGKPWEFGLHQCSRRHVWTAEEKELFEAIGHRIVEMGQIYA